VETNRRIAIENFCGIFISSFSSIESGVWVVVCRSSLVHWAHVLVSLAFGSGTRRDLLCGP
jgi:hypothetical protein